MATVLGMVTRPSYQNTLVDLLFVSKVNIPNIPKSKSQPTTLLRTFQNVCGGWWVVLESHFSVQLKPKVNNKPKLNKNKIPSNTLETQSDDGYMKYPKYISDRAWINFFLKNGNPFHSALYCTLETPLKLLIACIFKSH